MVKPVPDGHHTVTPHFTVKGASKAIEFYEKAFGATVLGVHEMGGKVGHAALKIGDSIVMLNDEFPEQGALGPSKERPSSVTLHLYVNDVDKAWAKAIQAGCQPVMPLSNMFWGDRYGLVKDPFHHVWSLATHLEDVTPAEMTKRAQQFMEGGACAQE